MQEQPYVDRYDNQLVDNRTATGAGAHRQSEVAAQYGDLMNGLERIAKVSEDLELRLGSVLRPEPSIPAGGAQEVQSELCLFATSIRTDAQRLHQYAARLESICQRIEV
jgi:hypothetical protein